MPTLSQQLRGPLSRVSGIKAYVQNIPAIASADRSPRAVSHTPGTDTTQLYQCRE
jgi:hypothetical protein